MVVCDDSCSNEMSWFTVGGEREEWKSRRRREWVGKEGKKKMSEGWREEGKRGSSKERKERQGGSGGREHSEGEDGVACKGSRKMGRVGLGEGE